MGYRIAEVAAKTGFPAATLRYYEDIGLLPPPERTDAGYRTYDDRAVARLGFIARAKQLGCTLEEITELAAAWDDDECGPVQHRLRGLVATKITETQHTIAELVAFTADLQAAATALEARPLDGPCDDTCGCMTSAEGPAIACTLRATDLDNRIADWRRALAGVVERTPIDGGVRLTLDDPSVLPDLARLVHAERGCCGFFDFALTVDGRGIGLEVTAPPEAFDMVAALFGATTAS